MHVARNNFSPAICGPYQKKGWAGLPYGNAVGEKGQRMFQKLRALLFFHNSRFTATESRKALIIAIALPIRISSSSSCTPSLVNATLRHS